MLVFLISLRFLVCSKEGGGNHHNSNFSYVILRKMKHFAVKKVGEAAPTSSLTFPDGTCLVTHIRKHKMYFAILKIYLQLFFFKLSNKIKYYYSISVNTAKMLFGTISCLNLSQSKIHLRIAS